MKQIAEGLPARLLRGVMAVACVAALAAAAPAAESGTTDESEVALVRFNTIYGPVGLISVPTAYVTPFRKVLFATAFARDEKTIGGNWGITPGVEVGGVYLDRDNNTNKAIGNAKVNIVPANFKQFEVGIGVIDAADARQRTFYFMASADWAVPEVLEERGAVGFRIHGGVGTGMFNEKPIGGAEVIFNKKFSAVAEWDTHDLNAGFRYVHDGSFRLQAGFHAKKVFVGATYALQF